MTQTSIRALLITAALAAASLTVAADDPRLERHELMEDVGDAAKPIGAMLKGERGYEQSVVMSSLKTFEEVSMRFGELFPPGTETGEGTEAAPAIWEDREGFEAALADWRTATLEALAAQPETLDAAKPLLGNVFNQCKNCHDNYRIDD